MYFDRSSKQTSDVVDYRGPSTTVIGFTLKCILITACVFCSGCTSFNAFEKTAYSPTGIPSDQVEFQRGQPNNVVDSIGNVLGIPNKLVLLDNRADNHQVSPETEMALNNYLIQNQLEDVLVRSNQYDPIGEWRRMKANDNIRPIWRLTVGNYNLLKYTLLPGRLTGGDWYNPYTNTINLYSDIPSLAISKGAYAYDIRTRLNPGAYAAAKEIPFVGLAHGNTATQNTLAYYENSLPDELYDARQILEPNNGAAVGGQLLSFVPYGSFAGRLIGSGVGRLKSKFY